MWSLLATICILAAAFVISSKYAIKPKVRMFAFSSYTGACICFIGLGLTINDSWLIIQQIVLLGLNVRGIYNAIKELKREKL